VIKKVSSKQALAAKAKQLKEQSSGSEQAIDNKVAKSFRSSTGFGGLADKALAGTASTNEGVA
jgi:hypothetical protein